MPASLEDVLASADQLLDVHTFKDYGPIGLQVRGTRDRVEIVASSVSSTRDAFERAASLGADLLLVHHGLFWSGTSQVIDRVMRERLRVLFDAGITLAAYHLPLDGHAEVGNNACIARALGVEVTGEPFAVHGGKAIGLIGTLAAPTPLAALADQVQQAVGGRVPLVLGGTPGATVRRIAICSGGAAGNLEEAASLGCDALLTGEPREDSAALARELGVALIAAGHHATETFGVRALGEHLAAQHGLRHEFLDADNPV